MKPSKTLLPSAALRNANFWYCTKASSFNFKYRTALYYSSDCDNQFSYLCLNVSPYTFDIDSSDSTESTDSPYFSVESMETKYTAKAEQEDYDEEESIHILFSIKN